MVTIIAYVISGVFFAFECGAAMERKGYESNSMVCAWIYIWRLDSYSHIFS